MKVVLIIVTLALSGCGSSEADSGGSAVQLQDTPPGVSCYVIYAEGHAVGGNCVKN